MSVFEFDPRDELRQNVLFSGLDCLPGQLDLFDVDADGMTTITIRQPWASLIAAGVKRVENRVWKTKHRGPLFIHAGSAQDANARGLIEQYRERLPAGELPFGKILGAAWLYGCFQRADLPAAWHGHEFAEADAWCWALGEFIPLDEPLVYSGQQGLFVPKVEGEARAALEALQSRVVASYDEALIGAAA